MLNRQAKVIRYRGAYYVQAALDWEFEKRKPGEDYEPSEKFERLLNKISPGFDEEDVEETAEETPHQLDKKRQEIRQKLQERLEKEKQEREEQLAEQRRQNLERAREVRIIKQEETPISVRDTPVSRRPKRKREDYWKRRERGKEILEKQESREVDTVDPAEEIQRRNERIQEKAKKRKNEWILQRRRKEEEAKKRRKINEKLKKKLRQDAEEQYATDTEIWNQEVKERFPEQYEWLMFLEKGQRLKEDFPDSYETWKEEFKRRVRKHKEPSSEEWRWLRNLRPKSPRYKDFVKHQQAWKQKLEELRKKYPPTGEEREARVGRFLKILRHARALKNHSVS